MSFANKIIIKNSQKTQIHCCKPGTIGLTKEIPSEILFLHEAPGEIYCGSMRKLPSLCDTNVILHKCLSAMGKDKSDFAIICTVLHRDKKRGA